MTKYENDNVQLAIATSRHTDSDGPIVLQPSHLLGAFLMLGFGLAAGMLAFLVEMMLGKMAEVRKANQREIFRSPRNAVRPLYGSISGNMTDFDQK